MVAVDTGERLFRITSVVREEVLKHWQPDSCIASTRTLIEVLNYFGHTAIPLPVVVLAFNPAAWKLNLEGAPIDQWPAEAWSVGVQGSGVMNRESNRWDGHLVALVDNERLLDPSLDQLTRPERGIPMSPGTFRVANWSEGTQMLFERPDGVVIIYERMQDAGDWRKSPDWSKRESLIRSTAGSAIRRLRDEFEV